MRLFWLIRLFRVKLFFDYLTDMQEGDEFYVHVLDRVLKYEVDQIEVILPTETDSLRVVSGEDYVTLLTCTPYSVNTHRLLVRGTRVEYDDSVYITSGASIASFGDEGIFLLGVKIPYPVAILSIVGFALFVIVLVIIGVRRSSKKKKQKHLDENRDGD